MVNKVKSKIKKEEKINEINYLKQRIISEAPLKTAATLLNDMEEISNKKNELKKLFEELPISKKTLRGLSENKYIKMTHIQKESIPHALAGRDILGAAKTGSGKTLAFVIPILECLFRNRWMREDGLGALIISPTRELALQTFEVLRKVGKYHTISASVTMGGRSKGIRLMDEKKRIGFSNVLVTTPGRLLQHLGETSTFSCDNLQILVLDEADRLLDLGFRKELNSILKHMPIKRQTLLFSATQTRSLDGLAQFSLVSPEFIAPHERATLSTPKKLMQQYIEVEAHQKFELFYGFLRTHLRTKIILFVSTRKQAQFLFEAMRRIRPGIPLSCIHGKQTQNKRFRILEKFTSAKYNCMITTDVCSRGLDINGIEWVINFDCPANVEDYIHRVGRTARFKSNGFSLLFLLPSELEMANKLRKARVPLSKVCKKNNNNSFTNLSSKFASFIAEDNELRYTAQRAVISYVKALSKRKDKKIFDVKKIDLNKLCLSMGLANKAILSKEKSSEMKKNIYYDLKALEKNKKNIIKELKKNKSISKIDKLMERKNSTIYNKSKLNMRIQPINSDDFFIEKKIKKKVKFSEPLEPLNQN